MKDVIEGVVMTGSGSANKAIVDGATIAVKSKNDVESYSLITGANDAAADEDGVDNGMPLVINYKVTAVFTFAGDIVKKYVLPS